MYISDLVKCKDFPCSDVNIKSYQIPTIDINPEKIKILMIAEAMPENKTDSFYSKDNPIYMETTLQAFKDAGLNVNSIEDIVNQGFYLTTAIKCAKTSYAVSSDTIKKCSYLLEKEIDLFPNIKAILLMGDVAIKAMNYISLRKNKQKVIPPGSTYKIRKNKFYYNKIKVFPSYLMTGKNYLIEKAKRKMIAEDIKKVMEIL